MTDFATTCAEAAQTASLGAPLMLIVALGMVMAGIMAVAAVVVTAAVFHRWIGA